MQATSPNRNDESTIQDASREPSLETASRTEQTPNITNVQRNKTVFIYEFYAQGVN